MENWCHSCRYMKHTMNNRSHWVLLTWSRAKRWWFHKISTWQWGLPWLDWWNNISRQTWWRRNNMAVKELKVNLWLTADVGSHLDEPGGRMPALLKVLLPVLLLDLQSQAGTQDALQPHGHSQHHRGQGVDMGPQVVQETGPQWDATWQIMQRDSQDSN